MSLATDVLLKKGNQVCLGQAEASKPQIPKPSVVGRIASKDIQVPIATPCEHGSLYSKNLRLPNKLTLKQGDPPRLSGWPNVITRVLKWKG